MSLQLASSVVIFTSNHDRFKSESGGIYGVLTSRSFC